MWIWLILTNNNVVVFASEELHFFYKYELGNQALDVMENRMDSSNSGWWYISEFKNSFPIHITFIKSESIKIETLKLEIVKSSGIILLSSLK